MTQTFPPIQLTPALINAAHPTPVADDPTVMPLLDNAELDRRYWATMAAAGNPQEVWVFGYGSLMWHPELDYQEERLAVVHGWHRRFCLWQWAYRATREQPGLMLALDRGGACKGMVFRLSGGDLKAKLNRVWEREMRADGYRPRWVQARTSAGIVPALTFVAHRGGRRYADVMEADRVAGIIARACGSKGPGASYLLETVLRCRALGIHDRYLWDLQRRVAMVLDQESIR